MKYRIIAFICSTLWPILIYGQSDSLINNNKYYIYIYGGLGQPVGEFGTATDGTYAQPGVVLNSSFILPVKKSIYNFILNVGYNANSINLQDYLNNHYNIDINHPYAKGSGRYEIINTMIGLILNFPKNWKNSYFNAHLLVGGAEVYSPYLSYNVSFLQGNQLVEESEYINSMNSLGLAYDVGIGGKIHINENYIIAVNIDYFLAAGIADKAINSSPATLLNATVGIGYEFGNQYKVKR